ncbi:MAG TPA: threonine--tRNA ligase [Verrucomicrobiae bacterium]|nr:threonine--tRNA ligase [Verrucomicrobiae bacterium]
MNEVSPEQLHKVRHSLSHILAMAVLEVFPEAKLAIGPAIDNGFYYDFDLPRPVTPEDLTDLQARMERLVKEHVEFTVKSYSIEEGLAMVAGQPYKEELIRDLAAGGETEVTFYRSGNFVDLCKGPHIATTKEIADGCFKLSHVSGAYWRGDEKRPMLQRIYGLAFESEQELSNYIQMMEEAKKRDHRVLGPQLGIYMISEEVGPGLPLWLPRGETIKYLLQEYMRKKEEALGYQYVATPVMAHENLYIRSGHAQYYSEDMFSLTDEEGKKFYLKPMNCPHHHMIMEKLVTSYRDLPLKLAEAGGIYRNELSGTLTGLIRVRGPITQNDSHIYCTPEQLKEEFLKVLQLFKEVYEEVGISDYWFRLSLPDFTNKATKYGGDQQRWEDASQAIRQALVEFGVPFVEAEGEAAFYGPKLDVQIKNVTGKEDTIATSQVDILVPGRMGLVYTDEHGAEQHPIIIHRAILGSYERFTAFLIEQTAGNFPLWIAPEQVRVIAVSEQFNDAVCELASNLRKQGIRADVDISNESVGKKIRNASVMKVPAKIVIGQKELDARTGDQWHIAVNWRADMADMPTDPMSMEDFVSLVKSRSV